MHEYDYEFAEFIYYTPRSLDKESQFWPVRGGSSIAKPNYKVGPKRIECYSIHFVKEGEVRFEYQGKRVDLQKNDIFCLFPGCTYFYSMLPSESPLQLSWLALDGPRVKPLLELAGLTPDAPFLASAFTPMVMETAQCLLHSLRCAESWKPARALELQSLLYALFAGISPDSLSIHAAEPANWIRQCMDFMELHALEGISVQQVAAFAGVHRSYFSTVFTSQVGMTPMNYLQKLRMEKAERLLLDTEATVTEIALSLGYPNLYSFTRAFKNYHFVSPLSFRFNGDRRRADIAPKQTPG